MAKQKTTKKKKTLKGARPVKKSTGKAAVKTAPKKKAVKKAAPAKSKKPAAAKKKRKPETLMCFLTTACVSYYALPDDGYELSTLRQYRDTYLASTAAGKKLVARYYKISPEIVKQVEQDMEKKSVYAYIYAEIRSACSKIEAKELLPAKKIYTQMVQALMKRYHLS